MHHDSIQSRSTMSRDLLIAGAMKAGTTSLYTYLAAHPSIAPSAVKETHYYADDLRDHFASSVRTEEDVAAERAVNPAATFHHARIRSREVYDSLFPVNEQSRVRLEASPSYLPSAVAAGRIAAEAVDPLVVVVLRNPYERLLSHYEMNRGLGVTSGSLETILKEELAQGLPLVRDGQVALARLSLYADDVSRLIEAVGRERVLVLTTEQLKGDLQQVLRSICDGLNLPFVDGLLYGAKPHNRTLDPRTPKVNALLRRTGLLSFARRVLPIAVKQQLQGMYYKPRERGRADYESAFLAVQDIINNDLKNLASLLGSNHGDWICKP